MITDQLIANVFVNTVTSLVSKEEELRKELETSRELSEGRLNALIEANKRIANLRTMIDTLDAEKKNLVRLNQKQGDDLLHLHNERDDLRKELKKIKASMYEPCSDSTTCGFLKQIKEERDVLKAQVADLPAPAA